MPVLPDDSAQRGDRAANDRIADYRIADDRIADDQRATGGEAWDALVLAGGAARRLGGRDKPAEMVGGRGLLHRVLDAVGGAEQVIVVGPVRPTARAVSWTREDPPGSGPVPALAAGLAKVRAPLVMVLAADLPFLATAVVQRLASAVFCSAAAGAVVVDDTGASQWLLGCWRTAALSSALAGAGSGSLRAVMAPLQPLRLRLDDRRNPPPWYDCDTPADLARAAAWTEAPR